MTLVHRVDEDVDNRVAHVPLYALIRFTDMLSFYLGHGGGLSPIGLDYTFLMEPSTQAERKQVSVASQT